MPSAKSSLIYKMPRKDLYQILDIAKGATAAEIRKAYRKLVLKYHPDRAGSTAENRRRFQEVQEAYDILADEQKRKAYNTGGYFEGSGLSKSKPAYPSRKELYRIRIRVRPRRTRVGDKIEVVIDLHQIISDDFTLLGLQHFTIVSGPSAEDVKYKDNLQTFRRIRYTLIPLKTGYVPVGPVAVVYRGIRYVSNEVLISVNHAGSKIIKASRGIGSAHIVFALIFIIGFSLLIGYNIYHYGTEPLNNDKVSIYGLPDLESDRQLETGDRPYNTYYGNGENDNLMHNQVQFTNGEFYEVVVFLMDNETGKTVRHNYIRAGDEFVMEQIPNGKYYLKAYFGRDWNPQLSIVGQDIRGGFNHFTKHEIFKDEAQALAMNQFLKGDSLDFSIYRITLFPVADGNAKSEKTEEENFFVN